MAANFAVSNNECFEKIGGYNNITNDGNRRRKSGRQDSGDGNLERLARKRNLNRSGYNSYLKVELDERTMTFLHEITKQLQQDWAAESVITAMPVMDNTEVHEEAFDEDRFHLRIRPRSLPSLHLTFFFGGETLCALSSEELTAWHAAIRDRLAKSGFVQKLNNEDNERADALEDVDKSMQQENPATVMTKQSFEHEYWFRFKQFRLFPPRRNYLVVAELEASPAFHTLYRDVREIAKTSSCPELLEITKASKEAWIPHVTLANVETEKSQSAKNRKNIKHRHQRLQSLLDAIMLRKTEESNEESQQQEQSSASELFIFPSQITMGGPLPQAAPLDWDFSPQHMVESSDQR